MSHFYVDTFLRYYSFVNQNAISKQGTNTLRSLKEGLRDFPGGPVVKNLPSNAWDAGSIPSQGTKIPHATGQLSPPRHNY